MKKHSIKLATNTAQTTAGIATIIAPITPCIINRGRKAATVVNIAENTGAPILVAAKIAAFSAFKDLLVLKCSVCSPITIASSTTIPSAIIIPNRDIMFIV